MNSNTSTTVNGRRSRPLRTMVATTANTITTSLPEAGTFIVTTLQSANLAVNIVKLNLETTYLEELAEALHDLKNFKEDFNLSDTEFKALVSKSSLAYLLEDESKEV